MSSPLLLLLIIFISKLLALFPTSQLFTLNSSLGGLLKRIIIGFGALIRPKEPLTVLLLLRKFDERITPPIH
jgi:hypothetical protein